MPVPPRISIRSGKPMDITHYDAHDSIADGGSQIFRRRIPAWRAAGRDLDRCHYIVHIAAGEDVGAAFQGFRPLRDIAESYVGNSQDRTFFLNSPAVRKNATGVLFQGEEIDEADGIH